MFAEGIALLSLYDVERVLFGTCCIQCTSYCIDAISHQLRPWAVSRRCQHRRTTSLRAASSPVGGDHRTSRRSDYEVITMNRKLQNDAAHVCVRSFPDLHHLPHTRHLMNDDLQAHRRRSTPDSSDSHSQPSSARKIAKLSYLEGGARPVMLELVVHVSATRPDQTCLMPWRVMRDQFVIWDSLPKIIFYFLQVLRFIAAVHGRDFDVALRRRSSERNVSRVSRSLVCTAHRSSSHFNIRNPFIHSFIRS